MSTLRLLHTADLHLDSPFEGLPGAKAAQRRAEQRELLHRIARTAEDERVDIVLLAGDLLDSDSAYAETAEDLRQALGNISVPVFISPGNHDFYSAGSPYARIRFAGNVHIFKSSRADCIELPGLGLRVWGAAFTDRYGSEMLRGFSPKKKDGMRDIMCIHGNPMGTDGYNPVSEDDIAASGMDYIAFGHIHTAGGLRKAGNTFYAWPGCPEGRGFDETGEKNIYIVELGDGDCGVKSVNIAKRRYEEVTVDITQKDLMTAIEESIGGNTKNDIYRIILKGETDEAPDIADLTAALEGRFFSLRLRDETTIRRDIWESVGEDSLRGLFLTKLRKAYDSAANEDEREKLSQAVRWGLAALDRREEVVCHENK